MQVKVVSIDMIKPSSPTPDNLRHYKLSFLDQMSPRTYCPFIFYYSSSSNSKSSTNTVDEFSEISTKLKKSLSQALALYYPLAGRVTGAGLVHCTDEGALFAEAHADGTKLCAVLENPVIDMSEFNKLLPVEIDEVPKLPLAVQLTAFSCGGITVGVCVDHLIGDALSSLLFLQNWTAIAGGQADIIRPEFVSSHLFPAKHGVPRLVPSHGVWKGMRAATKTKRFVFEGSKIEALRVRFSREGKQPVSRVGALSAFLWTRFARSTGLGEPGHPAREYAVILAANIRPKCDPPLPSHSFGNYYTLSATTGPLSSSIDEEEHCKTLASRLGQDLRKIDKAFVEYIRHNGDGILASIEREQARVLKGEVIGFFLSSLCRFPIYEANFGLGKPVWVSSAARGFENSVTFFDKKDSDGIEAFICLKHEDMAKLEADKEFLSFITTAPIINGVTA